MAGKMRDFLAVAAVLVLAASTFGNLHEPKAAAFSVKILREPPNTQAHAILPKNTLPAVAQPAAPVTSQEHHKAAFIDDIVHQTKLGAQFLKTAAQLTRMLNAEEKAKMKDDAMMETTHDIVGYAKDLMASLKQDAPTTQPPTSTPPSMDFWTPRGPRPKNRPTCTVTSGYWDRECECEFIPKKNKKPNRPRPEEDDDDCDDDDDDDDDDDQENENKPVDPDPPPPPPPHMTRPRPPPRPVYPWHYENFYPRPEYVRPPEYYPHEHYYPENPRPDFGPSRPEEIDDVAERVERLIDNLIGLLDRLSQHIEDVHHRPGSHHNGIRTEQRMQLIKAPLATVDKLRSIMKNEKLVHSVKSSGGHTMERFLKEKLADIEAMVTYPDYLDNQLGKLGAANQPLVVQMQSIIDKLEPLTH